jgi:hypothetical protein
MKKLTYVRQIIKQLTHVHIVELPNFTESRSYGVWEEIDIEVFESREHAEMVCEEYKREGYTARVTSYPIVPSAAVKLTTSK